MEVTHEIDVVLNKKYGGFDLSDKAMELYLKRKGIQYYIGNNVHGEPAYHWVCSNEPIYASNIPRNDATLVSVIRDLGEDANTIYSKLVVERVTINVEIDNYDGKEFIKVSTLED